MNSKDLSGLFRPQFYILAEDGSTPIPSNIDGWVKWRMTHNPQLAWDKVNDVRISTIFLGVDKTILSDVPLLWETIIFGGYYHLYQNSYPTLDAAVTGHQRAVQLVKTAPEPEDSAE
jgi:hypothetical protein